MSLKEWFLYFKAARINVPSSDYFIGMFGLWIKVPYFIWCIGVVLWLNTAQTKKGSGLTKRAADERESAHKVIKLK